MRKITKKIIKMLGGYVWDDLPWKAKMEIWKDREEKSHIERMRIILNSGYKTQFIHEKPRTVKVPPEFFGNSEFTIKIEEASISPLPKGCDHEDCRNFHKMSRGCKDSNSIH